MQKMSGDVNRGEADAFDKRMRERVQRGLLPDLRLAQPCDWFYNNPWRHPKYINMIYGEYLKFALSNAPKRESDIFEVGSGLGQMSLEMARYGHKVVGVELSPYSVDVANQTALNDPFDRKNGTLQYDNVSFFEWDPGKKFDMACFFQTLHHFSNVEEVVQKTSSLLNPNGRIIVVEPARDWFSVENAMFVAIMRIFLSASGKWYKQENIPQSQQVLDDYVNDVWMEFREAREKGEREQSPLDNSAFATQILNVLKMQFREVAFKTGFAFLPRMVGGLRGESDQETEAFADFLALLDEYCVQRGMLAPGVFYFAGEVLLP